jgi:hypothetical protein
MKPQSPTDDAIVAAMGDGWVLVSDVCLGRSWSTTTVYRAFVRQLAVGSVERVSTVVGEGKSRNIAHRYHRTGLPVAKPMKPCGEEWRVRMRQIVKDAKKGDGESWYEPPTQRDLGLRRIEVFRRWLDTMPKREDEYNYRPPRDHMTPKDAAAIYLAEWRKLRKNWQPYTIPAEPITTTDYEPAPDHPWRATQDRRTA